MSVYLSQHVPLFVNDGDGGWKLEAATLAKLLALPQVQVYAIDTEPVERLGKVTGWLKDGSKKTVTIIHPAPEERRFFRFSISGNHLMVEHNHGDHFWVVGYIRSDNPSELAALPEWKETETAKLAREAWNRGEIEPQKHYRCAEHNVEQAFCCLPR